MTGRYVVSEKGGVSRSQWDGWLEDSPGGGHILQSYEWGELKRRLDWEPVRLVLERDGEVTGLGQFLVYDTPLVPGTLWYCTKAPWLLWEDEEAVCAFFEGVRKVAERRGAHTVKIEPEVLEQQTRVKELFQTLGFRRFRWDLNFKTTMVVDLSPSEEDLVASMKGKTRYNIRLAARRGVEVVEDNSLEARERFWGMFEQTAKRNGFVIRRPRDYNFVRWRAMYDAGRAHLFFAMHEGDQLAAMLVYSFGHKYWFMLGASTNEKRNLMPSHLLQWEVMRWARQRGITRYDMVAVPSPDNLDNQSNSLHGVYRFEVVRFGGEIEDFVGCLEDVVPEKRRRRLRSGTLSGLTSKGEISARRIKLARVLLRVGEDGTGEQKVTCYERGRKEVASEGRLPGRVAGPSTYWRRACRAIERAGECSGEQSRLRL